MRKAIMTSSEEVINKIRNNEVTFELSKRGLREEINVMYLYQRKPVGKVVLKLNIDQIFYENPLTFFEKYQAKLGYDLQTWTKNYGSYEKIYFYHIASFEELRPNLELKDLNKKTAPQSIQYVNI